MKKDENIVRYTVEDVAGAIARGDDKTDWERVKRKTDIDIAADTMGDPALHDLDETWVRTSQVIASSTTPGREQQVAMRFDPDVLEHFKKGGPDWQGRINAALRTFIAR